MKVAWVRYERGDRFWAIALDEERVSTLYGVIGGIARETAKQYGTVFASQKRYTKAIGEKLAKGYELAPGGDRKANRNSEIEQKVQAGQQDGDYLVYADWLQSQGDPRGEFVALSHSLEADPPPPPKERRRIRRTRKKLLDAHAGYLQPSALTMFAALTKSNGWDEHFSQKFEARWRNGFIEEADLAGSADEIALVSNELLRHPSARFLQRMRIRYGNGIGWGDTDPHFPVEAFTTKPPVMLKALEIGQRYAHFNTDVRGLWEAVPNVETFSMYSRITKMGTIVHNKIKRFVYETAVFSEDTLASIVDARWPQLETLHIWFGADRNAPDELGGGGWDHTVRDRVPLIKPILDAKGLTRVRHLGLMNCAFTDHFVDALASSRILKQLETLSLWGGTMAAEGARVIIEHADRFAHLQALDLGDNFLTPDIVEQLDALPLSISLEDQDEPGDWGDDDTPMRYVSVAE